MLPWFLSENATHMCLVAISICWPLSNDIRLYQTMLLSKYFYTTTHPMYDTVRICGAYLDNVFIADFTGKVCEMYVINVKEKAFKDKA